MISTIITSFQFYNFTAKKANVIKFLTLYIIKISVKSLKKVFYQNI